MAKFRKLVQTKPRHFQHQKGSQGSEKWQSRQSVRGHFTADRCGRTLFNFGRQMSRSLLSKKPINLSKDAATGSHTCNCRGRHVLFCPPNIQDSSHRGGVALAVQKHFTLRRLSAETSPEGQKTRAMMYGSQRALIVFHYRHGWEYEWSSGQCPSPTSHKDSPPQASQVRPILRWGTFFTEFGHRIL